MIDPDRLSIPFALLSSDKISLPAKLVYAVITDNCSKEGYYKQVNVEFVCSSLGINANLLLVCLEELEFARLTTTRSE
jgi:hypothetical protein